MKKLSSDMAVMDISGFGYREMGMAMEILDQVSDGNTPDEFDEDGMNITFNMNSGNVFLSNSNYQVAMMRDGKLEMWYDCPICGAEGFLDEVNGIDNHHGHSIDECKEWIQEITGEEVEEE